MRERAIKSVVISNYKIYLLRFVMHRKEERRRRGEQREKALLGFNIIVIMNWEIQRKNVNICAVKD